MRRTIITALTGVALTMIATQVAPADDAVADDGQNSTAESTTDSTTTGAPVYYGGNGAMGPSTTSPVLNAGLYPMPVQTVPPRIGGTYITNPAFYPHEYLYAHEHHYLAPPFYRTRMWDSHNHWKHYHKDRRGPYSELGCPHGGCYDDCPGGCPGDCYGGCHGGGFFSRLRNCFNPVVQRGTEVSVKYKSKRHLFMTKFLPPR